MPVLAAHGCHITTVEGVGSVQSGKEMHPVQQAMVDLHGSQCGFCTPGIIVSLYTLWSENPSMEHLQEHLDGNLCRCTGYRPIWDAARSICTDNSTEAVGPCGTPCRECPERDDCEQECNVEEKKSEGIFSTSSHDKTKMYPDLDVSKWQQQPNQMFPKDLLEAETPVDPLFFVDKTAVEDAAGTWLQPNSLPELLRLKQEFPNSKLVVGNTEVGIEVRFKHSHFSRLIAPSDAITEIFQAPRFQNGKLSIGSCCPLSTIQQTCLELGGKTCMPMHDMLRWFASTQIRNVASLGGNLVTASPISDMNPLLASMNASLVLTKMDDGDIVQRMVKVSEFFLKYRVVALEAGELVERIEVPVVRELEYVKPFKQARRREDDISIVTSGMRILLAIEGGKYVVKEVALAFGGMVSAAYSNSCNAKQKSLTRVLTNPFYWLG